MRCHGRLAPGRSGRSGLESGGRDEGGYRRLAPGRSGRSGLESGGRDEGPPAASAAPLREFFLESIAGAT